MRIREIIAALYAPSLLPSMGGGGGVARNYEIAKSLRFRASASTFINRTPSVTGNRKTWTWSAWVKRGTLGTLQHLFNAWGGNSDALNTGCYISAANKLVISGYTVNWRITTQTFSDPTAWYHISIQLDTTLGSASDRWKIYVNGIRITAFDTVTDPSLNADLALGHNISHRFGTTAFDGSGPFDGYLAEFHYTNGLALGPNSFGKTDPISGQWIPVKYTGTYGVNGFYLDFASGINLTALGADASGAGNNWTLNNFSLTSGVNYDWMDDSPTNNYAVLNSIVEGNLPSAYAYGNLRAGLGDPSNGRIAVSSIGMSSGKWYFEATMVNVSGNSMDVGILGDISNINRTNLYVGTPLTGYSYGRVSSSYANAIRRHANFIEVLSGQALPAPGDVIGIAFDADLGELTISRNGVSVGMIYSGIPAGTYFFAIAAANNAWDVNFGQRPFSYAPPSGSKPLCSKNLRNDSLPAAGSYTGNASASGPYIWCNGTPETLTINGNVVTWGTHADKLANGFKLRTANAGYNATSANNWSGTFLAPSRKSSFRNQRAKVN